MSKTPGFNTAILYAQHYFTLNTTHIFIIFYFVFFNQLFFVFCTDLLNYFLLNCQKCEKFKQVCTAFTLL